MRYIMLIYDNEATEPAEGSPEQGNIMAEYGAFTQDVASRGMLGPSERLKPVATATTVRVREGKTLVTDGPFADTREQLGGFYILDCKDMDEALACAAKIPTARYGSIEVRPIWEME